MENGNGRKKRELRSQPGECWFACEFCGDHFHHNGLGMHRFHCAKRDKDERYEYAARKHTLHSPKRNNTVTQNVPVQFKFYIDREKEHLHVSASFGDEVLLKLADKARELGHVVLPSIDEE